jgi:hypothetical protein
MLNIQFDENAPNFSKDKDVICWCPSIEEWAFANEAFDILAKGQSYKHGKTPKLEQNEAADKEDFISQPNEQEIVDKFLEKNK